MELGIVRKVAGSIISIIMVLIYYTFLSLVVKSFENIL